MPTKIPPLKKGGKKDNEVEEEKNQSSEGGKVEMRSDSDNDSVVEGTQMAEAIKNIVTTAKTHRRASEAGGKFSWS